VNEGWVSIERSIGLEDDREQVNVEKVTERGGGVGTR
jgi:hypothetical protein